MIEPICDELGHVDFTYHYSDEERMAIERALTAGGAFDHDLLILVQLIS